MGTAQERRLTKPRTEIYFGKICEVCPKLNQCHKDIHSIISTIQETIQENPNTQDINNVYHPFQNVCKKIETISHNYIDFLSQKRVAESENEKSTHLKVRDHVLRIATLSENKVYI
jgi:predicted patatin/cPLA2 family phospholipase